MSYRNLEIYTLSRSLAIEIHHLSLSLPKHEQYETGSQIRRSSKSVRSNIVEGYGRRRYKKEFIRFLSFAQASADETADHLECLYQLGSIKNEEYYAELNLKYSTLGKMIIQFIKAVEKRHDT
jgi:four helix bundle protein